MAKQNYRITQSYSGTYLNGFNGGGGAVPATWSVYGTNKVTQYQIQAYVSIDLTDTSTASIRSYSPVQTINISPSQGTQGTSLNTEIFFPVSIGSASWSTSNPTNIIFMGQDGGNLYFKLGGVYSAGQTLGTITQTAVMDGVTSTRVITIVAAEASASYTCYKSSIVNTGTVTVDYQLNGGSWTTMGNSVSFAQGSTLALRGIFNSGAVKANKSISCNATQSVSSAGMQTLTLPVFTPTGNVTVYIEQQSTGGPQV